VIRGCARSRATGKAVAMNLHHFFTLRDGKIV
jgi:ketosteroid isomerase-like protein